MSQSQGSEYSIVDNDNAQLDSVVVDNYSDDEGSEFDTLTVDFESKYQANTLHEFLDNIHEKTMNYFTVRRLNKLILISSSKVIDELDEGGSCVLHKTLQYFIEINYKDQQGVDVIELMLNKSYLNYCEYQKGIVLTLLQKYDKTIKPVSIKFLQWQILSRKGEEMIVRWQEQQQENTRDVKKFVSNVQKAINDNDQLDNMLESILASGSLALLKYVKRLIDDNKKELVTPIVINAVFWGVFAKRDNIGHFQKCFEYLLEVADKRELCLVDDNDEGLTALHVADRFRDDYMVRQLLAKGAPITVRDIMDRFPIENTSFKTLQEFFDSLVRPTPTTFLEDESVWKLINAIYNHEYNLDGFIFMDFSPFEFFDDKHSEFNDLELSYFISESPRLNRLIDHPIPATLLELRWSRFKKWILLDQISVLYMLIFSIVFVGKYFLKSAIPDNACEIIDYASVAFSIFFLLENLVKSYHMFEVIGVTCVSAVKFIARKETSAKYYRKISKYPMYRILTSVFLKMPLLMLMTYYALHHCDHHEDFCKQTIGLSIILLSINVTLLIAYFSQTVAHYVIMSLYVAFTGSKFILSMFLILVGFGMGLFMLIDNFKEFNYEHGINTTKHVEHLESIGLSIFRAFVMSTGELDATDLKFIAISSYIVFIFFIFVVPIVFFNLLNGLAIEDISAVKREAMFWYRKTQLMVLNEFYNFYWKVNKRLNIVKRIDISLHPHVIGEKAFIGINTLTREIYSMDGLTTDERSLIGRLSSCNIANAEEILRNRNQL